MYSAKLYKYILILFLFYFLIGNKQSASAQTQNSTQSNSSFQNSVYEQKSNSLRLQNTNLLEMYLDSARLLANKAPMKAVEFINKAIEQCISSDDRENEAVAYLILGDIQQGIGQHDLAIENYKKSIKVLSLTRQKKLGKSSINNNATLFTAHRQAAVSFGALSNYDNALLYINKCFNQFSLNVSQKELLEAKRVLADIYLKQGETQKSRGVLNEVLPMEQSNKNTSGEILTQLALGKTHQKDGNENSAIEKYTTAKELSEKIKNSELTIQSNGLLASVYRSQKQVEKEVEARNFNIALNTSSNNSTANVKENIEIGNAYLNVKNVDKAANYYDLNDAQTYKTTTINVQNGLATMQSSGTFSQQQQLFSASTDLEEGASAYKTLAEEYLKQKDVTKASIYFTKYADLQDSIKTIRKKEFDEAIALSTNIGKNQQRVDLLEKERELNEKSIDILKQDKSLKEEQLDLKNYIIGSLSILVALMLIAVFFVIRSSREKKKVHQLLALKSLRGQMNPHFIFNALNSVNHYVSQNDERQANRYLSDFSRLMRLVMDSSKHDFISITDELEMLRLYMQLEHARFKDKFDYEITIAPEVEDGDFEIPPMLIQPYLENAVWHGLRYIDGKGMLKMEINKTSADLLISITDNGIGRAKSSELKTQNQKKQTSLGMQNIKN
jgi:tetratricopeptide (TPR) repeat protein